MILKSSFTKKVFFHLFLNFRVKFKILSKKKKKNEIEVIGIVE